MISYAQAISVIETFANNHPQIQKFGVEFKEQMQNIAAEDEKYPMLFVVPVGGTTLENVVELELDIYCMDRLQKDRTNTKFIISDTQLILTDLTIWLEDIQTDLEVIKAYPQTPINNDLLDYCGGWVMRLRVQVEKVGFCEIPIGEAEPGGECEDATVINSDASYQATVESGGVLVLPDTTYNFVVNGNTTTVTIPTLKDETINVVWQ